MVKPKQKSLVREIMDVLKEQRALFALMLAYAGAIVAALFKWREITQKWIDLSQGKSVWILYSFAFLPVLVPAVVVIVRRWRRAALERRLADVGKQQLSFRHGHFRTTPYGGSEEDRKAYERTDRAHEQALDRIWAAAEKGEPLFFLHSPSGCGKTSLLQASVIPALEKQGWRVIALRGFTGILPELAEALGLAETATTDEIRAVLAVEAKARREAGGTLLVVVDQFEEFLILHPQDAAPWQAVREWFTAIRAGVPGLQVLLSMRSEYQAMALKLGLPDFDSARSFVVPLFSVEDAREFLRRGLQAARKKTGELPLDQFIRQMEDRDDTRGMVRPIHANLVGQAYRTYAAEFHARLLAGKRIDFLADWLHRLLERRELRLHARPVFEGLLQKDGSRCPARVAQIAAEGGLTTEQVRTCLAAFENEGLVRCLSPMDAEDVQKLWEISHDFLAVQIKRALSFWRRLWQESVARAVAPAAIGLWLLAAAAFLLQDTEHIHRSRLQDLGFSWNQAERKASVFVEQPYSFGSTGRIPAQIKDDVLTKVAPSLRALRCETLNLSGCYHLTNVNCLKDVTTLRRLDLFRVTELQDIDGIKTLDVLTSVNLAGCKKLRNVDVLKGLTALTNLNLSGCSSLQNVDVLKGLTALTDLNLSGCSNLQNVDGLKGLTAITNLDLSSCSRLQNVDGLKSLTALTDLKLSNCTSLQSVDGLKGLTALINLNLSSCSSLQNVDGLEGLPTLTHLDLSECTNLQNVDGLKGLTVLTILDLSDCTNLENVEALKGLTALTDVDLDACPKITQNVITELKTALPNADFSLGVSFGF